MVDNVVVASSRRDDEPADLDNLAHLHDLGQQVNRKLLEVERISHHCVLTQEALDRLARPPSGSLPGRLNASRRHSCRGRRGSS
jgi:hypothetical protein